MRNPNGYGSVVYLGKKRRKPYAVRVTSGYKEVNGRFIQQYKYLGYFEKSKDANMFLANYNSGKPVKEHISYIKEPTFAEVYEAWITFKRSRNNPPGESTFRNYGIVYKYYADVHQKKICNIRVDDIQKVADAISDKSNSTVTMAKTVATQMFDFAIRRQYVDINIPQLCDWDYTKSEEEAHTPFSDAELELLWSKRNVLYVDIILIMIYTGLRASEFLEIENENINFDEQYIICGKKTDAGRNRVVPIHDAILPFIRRYYKETNKYLFPNTKGHAYYYTLFRNTVWKNLMNELKMDHTPHDTRHTFATLADRYKMDDLCLKLIIGHTVKDLTKGTYTHKLPSELLAEMQKIQIPES
jgi:integrase